MLQVLGLDDVAHSVYRTVLARKGSDVTEIAAQLKLPEAVVRCSIDKLVTLSLLRKVSGAYLPGSPTTALESLLQRQSADLARKQQEYAETKAAVSRLIAEYDQAWGSRQCNEWERLDGAAAIRGRQELLARQTRIECLSLLPTGTPLLETIAERELIDSTLIANGASVWNVTLDSAYNDRSVIAYAERIAEHGAETRMSPTLPTWLVVFDRRTALLPAEPDSQRASAFQVNGPGMILPLTALFERIWSTATKLGNARPPSEDQPTTMERELLRLLGQGLTDEAVSKKLGIGVRTARRMVADLMCRLDARSRFEAGANAVDRGWLTPCQCSSDRAPRVLRHEKCCSDEVSGMSGTPEQLTTSTTNG